MTDSARVIHVTPTQRKAAQALIAVSKRSGREQPEIVHLIANAHRASDDVRDDS